MSNPSAVIPNHLSTKIPIPLSLSLFLCFVECDDSWNERSSKRRASNRTPRCLFLPGDRRSFLFLLLFLFHAETRGGSDATSEGGGGRRKALERWQLWTRFRSARRLIVEVMVTRRLMKADRRIQNYFPVIESYRFIDMRFITISLYSFSCSRAFCLNRNRFKFYIYIYFCSSISLKDIYIYIYYILLCNIDRKKKKNLIFARVAIAKEARKRPITRCQGTRVTFL